MDKRKSLIASVFLALVALSWGSSYSIVKDSLSVLEPFTLMAFRFTTSGLLLSLIYAKKLLKITRKEAFLPEGRITSHDVTSEDLVK